MSQKDKQILVRAGLGVGCAAIAVFLFMQFFDAPLQAYNKKIKGLEDEIELKDQEIRKIWKDRLLVDKARQLSLHANPDKANQEYGNYLRLLLKSSKLTVDNFQPPAAVDIKAATAQLGKKAGHIFLEYTVLVTGDYAALATALEKLQRTPVLHRVKSLTVDRAESQPKDPKDPKLRIQMKIEAMIVNNLDKEHAPVLQPDMSKPLPSDSAKRAYANLKYKNIFVGPLPPPPPPEIVKKSVPPPSDDGIDVREHVWLVTTEPTSQEAFLRNRVFKEREKRLRTNPKSGFATFKIMTEEGRDVVKGRVMRIDQRDVYFQVGEDVYGIHIGQTLADAMRRPLSDQELSKLGLTELVEIEPAQKAPSSKVDKGEKASR